jgi:hypothetical protein
MFQVMLVSSQFADDSLYPISAREPEDVGQQEDVVLPQNTSHQGNAAMDGKQMEEPCEAMAAGLPLIPVSRCGSVIAPWKANLFGEVVLALSYRLAI